MRKIFLLSTLLFSISTLLAQDKETDNAVAFEKLSTLIEKEFNKRNTAHISFNGELSLELRFDSLNRFTLLDSASYYPKTSFHFNKLLYQLDQKTGILSNNQLFRDPSSIYFLSMYADRELKRVWFTNIFTLDKTNTDRIFECVFEIHPKPHGGMGNFLNKLLDHIKKGELSASILEKDTSWISFIIERDGKPRDAKINGIPHQNLQDILEYKIKSWSPGVYNGRPTSHLLKIKVNKPQNANDGIIESPLEVYSSEPLLMIDYPEYLFLRTYLSPEELNNKEHLIVSFIYKDGISDILGPVILQGSRRRGKQLLKIINHQMTGETLKNRDPLRFYVIVDETP